jgi:hypothetical protein
MNNTIISTSNPMILLIACFAFLTITTTVATHKSTPLKISGLPLYVLNRVGIMTEELFVSKFTNMDKLFMLEIKRAGCGKVTLNKLWEYYDSIKASVP